MLVIWGWKVRIEATGQIVAQRVCPVCKLDSRVLAMRGMRRFNVFWIPVTPWLPMPRERHVMCDQCGASSELTHGERRRLYCSSNLGLECSTSWYPAELDRYYFWTLNGTEHICERATGLYAGFDDLDCHRYSGGDPTPDLAGTPDLHCTQDLGSVDCSPDYYPSEWDGYSAVRIGYQDYICRDAYAGSECWRDWGTTSPRAIAVGLPDYYCNSAGQCSKNGYP